MKIVYKIKNIKNIHYINVDILKIILLKKRYFENNHDFQKKNHIDYHISVHKILLLHNI